MSDTPTSSRRLVAMAFVRIIAGVFLLAAMLFWPAGTWDYWQAWVYLAVIFVPMLFLLAYLLKNDPGLLERRLQSKETHTEQKLIVVLASTCYAVAFVLPGFDQRYGWSTVPPAVSLAADVVVLAGYGLFALVLRENSYASRTIEVEQGQRTITTGPYAVVRHPMYVAILMMLLATPVALGSWWAVIPALPLVAVLVARIRNEERVLIEELEGYSEYMQTTRYRLIPGVW